VERKRGVGDGAILSSNLAHIEHVKMYLIIIVSAEEALNISA
jgi:hypothetical protein